MNSIEQDNSYRLALYLVTSLFFMWGLSYGLLDVLNKHFQETLNVSHSQSGFLQLAYFGAYFIWAFPAAILMEKFGYKSGILLGLFLYAIGAFLFVPATKSLNFEFFLFALFIIASGISFLETAANPYITVLGSSKTSVNRLNLSQSFNGLGQFIGPLIGGLFFFENQQNTLQSSSLDSVQIVYVCLSLIVLAIAFLFWKVSLPDIRENEIFFNQSEKTKSLLKQRHFIFGVITQFFYIAAQVGCGAFFINFVTSLSGKFSSSEAAYLLSIALVLFMLGRFIGTFLLGFINAGKLLGIYGTINIFLVLLAIFVNDSYLAIGSMLLVFFFMSICFPTIFSLGVKNLGKNTKRGASFLVMAISGGAFAPYFMGLVSDQTNIKFAFFIPMFCFFIVAWYGFFSCKKNT